MNKIAFAIAGFIVVSSISVNAMPVATTLNATERAHFIQIKNEKMHQKKGRKMSKGMKGHNGMQGKGMGGMKGDKMKDMKGMKGM